MPDFLNLVPVAVSDPDFVGLVVNDDVLDQSAAAGEQPIHLEGLFLQQMDLVLPQPDDELVQHTGNGVAFLDEVGLLLRDIMFLVEFFDFDLDVADALFQRRGCLPPATAAARFCGRSAWSSFPFRPGAGRTALAPRSVNAPTWLKPFKLPDLRLQLALLLQKRLQSETHRSSSSDSILFKTRGRIAVGKVQNLRHIDAWDRLP